MIKIKIQPYIDKLNSSSVFHSFKEKNPNSYFSAGFFVLDFEHENNVHQIDYFNPESKKIITFTLDRDVEMKEGEAVNESIPNKIEGNINLDLDVVKGLIEDEMKNQTITTKLQKIIAVIQNIEGKKVWNLNCIATDMGLIKAHIDDETHSILKFEKINLFDVVRKL